MKNYYKKILTLVLIISFIFSPILATKAEAQWVVFDPSIATKTYGLDGIAWMVANLIIERMAASTVKWINSGFKGNPAFVTDPEAFFTDIGDKVAGQYIFSNPNLNFLCGPISAKIKLALTQNYIQDNQWQCTLTQVGKNMDNFMSSFENGGWDNFFELTQKTQNNPIGAYLMAENEMYLQISTRQGTTKQDLTQGNGFLSYKKCKAGTETTASSNGNGAANQVAELTCKTWNYNTGKNPITGVGNPPKCTAYNDVTEVNIDSGIAVGDCKDTDKEIVTPGSVIADQLNNQLKIGSDKLIAADAINEIVSALLNQLVSQVVGGIGNGLRGLSSPDVTNKGQIFTDQLSNSTAASTTDYFGNKQDTTILDTPIANPFCNPANPVYNPNDPVCTQTASTTKTTYTSTPPAP